MRRQTPIMAGVLANGEILWEHKPMELWQEIQLFYEQYQGDFTEQWMRLIMHDQGWDWDE